MKQLTLAGHPVHPQVISGPTALFPFTMVMDLMHVATGKKSYADAAYYSLVGGLATGVVSAVTGAADYLTISPGGEMKRMANTHALLNLGLMAVETANLAARRRRSSGTLPAALSMLGTVGVIVSAWYGGALVYKFGMRVKPATEKPQPEAKLPGDRAVERGLKRMASYAPAGGPGSEE
jgi:uncharacterized membrane protein